MKGIVLFGIGSSVIVDVEESIRRAGLAVVAGVRNHPSESYLDDAVPRVEAAEASKFLQLPFMVPLFGPGGRQRAVTEARSLGFSNALILVDPTVALPSKVDIDEGTYINAACNLGGGSVFGRFVFINRGVSIGHHAQVESFVSIAPGVVIAGHVTIERGAFIGVGSTILPKITIGENSIVGAGSVVTRDVAPQTLVMGNPARVIRRDIIGYQDMQVV